MFEINRNQEVTFMLHSNDRIVKHKVGLLNLADELGNISKACKMMGVSRDTFYRYQEAVNEGGGSTAGSESQSSQSQESCRSSR